MAAAEKRGIMMMARIAVVNALNHGQPVEPAAPEARQEIPDRQLERIRRATLIRPRAKMPPRL